MKMDNSHEFNPFVAIASYPLRRSKYINNRIIAVVILQPQFRCLVEYCIDGGQGIRQGLLG